MSKKFTPSLDPFARSKKTASSPSSTKKVGEEGSLPGSSKLVVEQGGGGSSPKPVRSQSPTLVKSRSPSVEEEVELFPKPVVPVTTAPPYNFWVVPKHFWCPKASYSNCSYCKQCRHFWSPKTLSCSNTNCYYCKQCS